MCSDKILDNFIISGFLSLSMLYSPISASTKISLGFVAIFVKIDNFSERENFLDDEVSR